MNSSKTVNDTVERAVKLMEEYYKATLTLDENQKQYIQKCVQVHHRKMYPDCKKSTLQQQY